MNAGSTNSILQSQMMQMGATNNGGSNGLGKIMRETMQMLPDEMQADIKSFMETLDIADKKATMEQISKIDASNMSIDDLTKSIMDIFMPSQQNSKSSNQSILDLYA